MSFTNRLQSRDFQWTAIAAFAVILVAAIPATWPDWFVYSTGQITILGGVDSAGLLALGLLLGWRWVRYLTLVFLTLVAMSTASWALASAEPQFQGGFLLLATVAAFAAGLLAFAGPVRSYFNRNEQCGEADPEAKLQPRS